MQQKIIILDFGSQTTQLIGRRVRELDTFCEILPYNKFPKDDPSVIGVILSGSPYSVHDPEAFKVDLTQFVGKIPVLGICYGAQFIAHTNGGKVEAADSREYGRANLEHFEASNPLFKGFEPQSQVWMSHGDTITAIPADCQCIASTANVRFAAYASTKQPVWAVQFHPEVNHTEYGQAMLRNFLYEVCGATGDWTMGDFMRKSIEDIRAKVGDGKVLLALSGGVDSSVAAALLAEAVGDQLTCVFVDHGFLRLGEAEQVVDTFTNKFNMKLVHIDASKHFMDLLAGVTEPEKKRKTIGAEFIHTFQEEANKLDDVKFLVQGTLYPDVVESGTATAATIKSHHNVGGLPKDMKFELIEPLRELFKDEVRQLGRELGLPQEVINRQPFPGPGLAIRIIGEITPERLDILRRADFIVRDVIKQHGLYNDIWQSFAVLPAAIRSVGVQGDERTYDYTVGIRAVTSSDGMTADYFRFPWEVLDEMSRRICNEVAGVNRVVYDVTSKPPSTIEWE